MMMRLRNIIAASLIAAGISSSAHATSDGLGTIPNSVDSVFQVILIVSVVIFTIIALGVVLCVTRYRRKSDVQPQHGASGSWRIQTGLVVSLVVILSVLFTTGMRPYAELVTSPGNSYEVYVTAENAAWTFEHRNGKVQDDAQLFVPADRPVRLIMDSRDVTYSLSLPAMRIKRGVFPDRETSLWFKMAAGEYDLECAEYCGDSYTTMTTLVTAFEPDAFTGAIDSIAFWLDSYTNDRLHFAGLRIYSNCASCHTLDGSSLIGPSFRETHDSWGTERTLEDGSKVTINEEYIRQSILDPQSQRATGYPGQIMTEFSGQFRDREIAALIEFIRRLDEVVDEQGNSLPEPMQP